MGGRAFPVATRGRLPRRPDRQSACHFCPDPGVLIRERAPAESDTESTRSGGIGACPARRSGVVLGRLRRGGVPGWGGRAARRASRLCGLCWGEAGETSASAIIAYGTVKLHRASALQTAGFRWHAAAPCIPLCYDDASWLSRTATSLNPALG